MLLLTGVASGAASFADSTGDDNASPDITSVVVSEPVAGTLSVVVTVGNYQTLPKESWFNLWFDLDRNSNTGDPSGDEEHPRPLPLGGRRRALPLERKPDGRDPGHGDGGEHSPPASRR